jgi:hypothetical protein
MSEGPQELPAVPRDQRGEDLEQLRLLSIAHYVVAAVVALAASIPLLHLAMGASFASAALAGGEEGMMLGAMGCLFMAIAGTIVAAGWGFAASVFLAGRFLASRQRYTFCLVVAAINCAFAPLGTALGVLTIIVLMRPSVKQLFAGQAAAGAA